MSNNGWPSTFSYDVTYEAQAFTKNTRNITSEEHAVDLLRSSRDSWSLKPSNLNESSAITDSIDVEMQDITDFGQPTEIYIIIDTNILISHLSVLKDLNSLLESSDRSEMPIVLLIPGIVIAELDFQKKCEREIAFESRKASDWLAKEIRNGQGIIKGQAYSQTLLPSKDWRQRLGLSNDELILDCCKYFTRVKQKDVLLCTNDNNLVIQAAANADELFSRDASVAILRPTSVAWDCFQIVQEAMPSYVRPSMHAVRRNQKNAEVPHGYPKRVYSDKMTRNISVPSMDADMDVDMDPGTLTAPRSSLQWRDYLHRWIVSELQRHVRGVVGSATHLQRERQKTESRYSRANSLFHGELPTEEDWMQNWSIRECLRYLVKILPPNLERDHPFQEGDASSLADFLSLPGERGARPGREWSKNDWERELVKISRLAQDYDYDGLTSESLYNYQKYVLMAFGDNLG